MSRTQVFEFHKMFSDGQVGVEDDEDLDRPST